MGLLEGSSHRGLAALVLGTCLLELPEAQRSERDSDLDVYLDIYIYYMYYIRDIIFILYYIYIIYIIYIRYVCRDAAGGGHGACATAAGADPGGRLHSGGRGACILEPISCSKDLFHIISIYISISIWKFIELRGFQAGEVFGELSQRLRRLRGLAVSEDPGPHGREKWKDVKMSYLLYDYILIIY